MKNPKNIPHLIKLLDDDSDDSRDNILVELASFGDDLIHELKKLNLSLNPTQQLCIEKLVAQQKRSWLKRNWKAWMGIDNDYHRLEAALTTLAEFLSDIYTKDTLPMKLDALAEEYKNKFFQMDAKILAQFLFKEKALQGNESDFYNPQNSNLSSVIDQKRGIPISLACIYMLVGYRLGIQITGCHFPGHFLARIVDKERVLYVDCFSSGQFIEEKDILKVREEVLQGSDSILKEEADAGTIIRRFLANLVRAYQISEDDENVELIIELFKDLDYQLNEINFDDLKPEDIIYLDKPNIECGNIVRHRRYGYRGIVVERDVTCEATDDWYYGNQTQPVREQPWYHVLVDGSDQVTYVAESNLSVDSAKDLIAHPLLNYFFTQSKDGHYVRNDNPWPETDF